MAKSSLPREEQGWAVGEVLRDKGGFRGPRAKELEVKGSGRRPRRKVTSGAISPSPPWACLLATFEWSHAVRRCPALLTVAVPAAVTDLEVQSKQ